MTNITSLVDQLVSSYDRSRWDPGSTCPYTDLDYATIQLFAAEEEYQNEGYDTSNLPDDRLYMQIFTAQEMMSLCDHLSTHQLTKIDVDLTDLV